MTPIGIEPDVVFRNKYISKEGFSQPTTNVVSDGSKTNYYNIPDWVEDLDDLIEYLDLGFDGGNCMKALFGMAIARKTGKTRHDGTSIVRDSNKLFHYSERINKKVTKDG